MQIDEFQPRLLHWFVIVVCVGCVSAAVVACAMIPPGEPAALLAAFLCLVWLGVIALGLKARLSESFETRAPERRRRMTLSVRGMMYIVGGLALVFWPARYVCQGPPDPHVPDYHGMMAFFCEEEAKLFQSRAEACLARAKNGTPWEDSGEDSEVLQLCPYPSDQRRHDSWLEQARIWERASSRARKSAQRHLSHQ
jgi:predicted membrane channel-forming protein YqfA (hemolysin III family)